MLLKQLIERLQDLQESQGGDVPVTAHVVDFDGRSGPACISGIQYVQSISPTPMTKLVFEVAEEY